MIYPTKKATHVELKQGQRVQVLEPITNGLIVLKSLDEGTIIYHPNQVEATVWFRHIGQYHSDPISQALQTDNSFGKNGNLDGIAVRLNKKCFAVRYDPSDMNEILVDEDKALTIPFFQAHERYRRPSNMKRNVGNGVFETVYQYSLDDIVDILTDSFSDWVEKNTKTRKIRKAEKENGDYPTDWDRCLTEESCQKFGEQKYDLELAFAKATGVFWEFNGGLLMN